MKFLLAYLAYAIGMAVALARRGFWSPPALGAKPNTQRIQRVLVIGATGGTGGELVSQALEQGYEVTALVRDPTKLAITHPRLTTMRGDVLDPGSVEAAVRGQD